MFQNRLLIRRYCDVCPGWEPPQRDEYLGYASLSYSPFSSPLPVVGSCNLKVSLVRSTSIVVSHVPKPTSGTEPLTIWARTGTRKQFQHRRAAGLAAVWCASRRTLSMGYSHEQERGSAGGEECNGTQTKRNNSSSTSTGTQLRLRHRR